MGKGQLWERQGRGEPACRQPAEQPLSAGHLHAPCTLLLSWVTTKPALPTHLSPCTATLPCSKEQGWVSQALCLALRMEPSPLLQCLPLPAGQQQCASSPPPPSCSLASQQSRNQLAGQGLREGQGSWAPCLMLHVGCLGDGLLLQQLPPPVGWW